VLPSLIIGGQRYIVYWVAYDPTSNNGELADPLTPRLRRY